MEGPFMAEEDEEKASSFVKDTRTTRMCTFLPASWVGNTHKETNVLPIGDQVEMEQMTIELSYWQSKTGNYWIIILTTQDSISPCGKGLIGKSLP